MGIRAFEELHRELIQRGLQDGRHIRSRERLLIFLYIVSNGQSFRLAAVEFNHLTERIHEAFHEALNLLCYLHKDVVLPPPDRTPDRITENTKYAAFFADCI
ncbi:hypothetical protein B0J12DRAFT_443315 [Macrophomina phaseolina]|uniref:DUF8040 domain-containing protein n=1 Tax=Macrophomina phaseolina TaxID=35725 RepID=A0ABQ8FQW5_9PEZI|nr:hypothetical protein B0J12DRAFT_443315 [Macrophomina phaseolina]